jgi:SAM-dependent methyltransferase
MKQDMIDRCSIFGEIPGGDAERIAPGFFESPEIQEHKARYEFAARWVRNKSVLDVACGTGYGSHLLLDAGAREVVAIDRNAAALAFAAEHYPGPTYIQADALHLPLKPAAFDVIVSLETIEHLSDPLQFLKCLRRLLKWNGRLVLSTPEISRTQGTNPYHVHEMRLSELFSALNHGGLHLIGLSGQYWHTPEWLEFMWWRWLGQLADDLEESSSVRQAPILLGFNALYWCVVARPIYPIDAAHLVWSAIARCYSQSIEGKIRVT